MKRRPHAHAEDDFTSYPKDAGTSGLSLFDQQPITPPAAPVVPKTIDEQFTDFHGEHPQVYAEITRLALEMHAWGRPRISIGQIVENVRYTHAVKTKGGDYKINNNFRSRYARLLVADHPELRDVVELRELRSA